MGPISVRDPTDMRHVSIQVLLLLTYTLSPNLACEQYADIGAETINLLHVVPIIHRDRRITTNVLAEKILVILLGSCGWRQWSFVI